MDGLEDQPDVVNMFPQYDDLDISDKVAVLKAAVDSLVHEFVDIEYHLYPCISYVINTYTYNLATKCASSTINAQVRAALFSIAHSTETCSIFPVN